MLGLREARRRAGRTLELIEEDQVVFEATLARLYQSDTTGDQEDDLSFDLEEQPAAATRPRSGSNASE